MYRILNTVLAFFILIQSNVFAQETIASARGKTPGSTVTVSGIVTNGSEFGIIRYFQDSTGGLAAYGTAVSSLQTGDSIVISGTLKDFNNLLELDPVTNVNVINSGNLLPAPKVLSLQQGFAEQYEGQLVTFEKVGIDATGFFSGNTNYDISRGGVTKQIRIGQDVDLAGEPIPGDSVTLTGIMSQYQSSYQLLLRSKMDIAQGAGPVITTPLMQHELTTSTIKIYFETEEEGNTILRYGISAALEMGEETDASLVTEHEIMLTGLSPATFYNVQGLSVDANGDTSRSSIQMMSTASLSSGDVKIYFNLPVDTSYNTGRPAVSVGKGIDDTLVAYLRRAKQSIDLALYNLNNNSLTAHITDAVNSAYDRGLAVRIVADGSTAMLGLNGLRPGIGVIKSPTGMDYGIMHNKFVIIDGKSSNPDDPLVWTGSTNLTRDQIDFDANNVIIIQDQALARAFVLEFEEMYGSAGALPVPGNAKFGPDKTNNTPQLFKIGGNEVELYFSPTDQTTAHIENALLSADEELYFATLLITRNELADSLINRHDAGVYVAGLMEDSAGSGSDFNLIKSSLGQRLRHEQTTDQLHHKYAIVDQYHVQTDPLLITGSHNWSTAAETRNDENTLIIHDDTLANIYFQEWVQRFRENGGTYTYSPGTGIEQKMTDRVMAWMPTLTSRGENIPVSMVVTEAGVWQILLVNLQGQQLMHRQFEVQAGANKFELPMPEISSGFYLLHFNNGKSTFTRKILIK